MSKSDIIWCLFSITNDYGQPDNNLVSWWHELPTIEEISYVTEGDLSGSHASDLLSNKYCNYGGTEYRLEQIKQGHKF